MSKKHPKKSSFTPTGRTRMNWDPLAVPPPPSPGRGTVREPYVTRQERPDVQPRPRWLPPTRWIIVGVLAAAALVTAAVTQAQPLLVGNRIEVPANVTLIGGPPNTILDGAFLRFTTGGGVPITEITSSGTLRMRWGATLDFSATMTSDTAGPIAGYAVVLVGGQPFLMPLFSMPPVMSMPGAQP